MEDLSENCDFEAAADFVKSNSEYFTTDSLLILYSRFKQVTVGKCNTPRPGFFDFQGKQKWDAWNKLGNMPKDIAAEEYMQEVSRVCPEWESQLKPPEKSKFSGNQSVFGVAVSTMVNSETEIDDEFKTVFDWCKDGNTKQVVRLLDKNNVHVNVMDAEGMSLLHWACDRGEVAMVETLLAKKANVNIQDADEQTPLHYAVICEHPEVVRLLLTHNAKTDVTDSDGQSVSELETTAEIKQILSSYPHR